MILKLAVLTSAFYVGIALLAEVALFAVARFRGGFMFHATLRGWAAFFAIVWLISFCVAWRIFSVQILARFPS